MKKLLSVPLWLALLALPLYAQHRGGGGHGVVHAGSGTHVSAGQLGRFGGPNPQYAYYGAQTYGAGYGAGYNRPGFYTPSYYTPSYYTPGYGLNGMMFGAQQTDAGAAPAVAPPTMYTPSDGMISGMYVPTYMRASDGPSLAEIAQNLKTARKPAVLTWSNWDSGANSPAVKKQ